MKIGLYGGLANNCYIFATVLHNAGQKVVFIRDRNDRYAFSQPVWEDSEFVMSYDSVSGSSLLSWEDWRRIEIDHNWKPPTWLLDPLTTGLETKNSQATQSWLSPLCSQYVRQSKHRRNVVDTMQACDVLLVCGIEAAILAMASGRPYIIWPHGGDIRMAAGLANPPKGFRVRLGYELQKILLLGAYDRASYVGTHDPRGLGGSAGDVGKALRRTSLIHLPIPALVKFRASKAERHSRLVALCQRLGIPPLQNEFIGLVPSRVDFAWKGHDLLLGALNRVSSKERLHLIFSGWGNDYVKAKDYVTRYGLSDHVTFLPFSLSKPLLAEFFSVVDFAVDQFRFLGTYGTALVEALAAGCPTLMWIDNNSFAARCWEPPPVMNAESEDDIVCYLERISCGTIDLEEFSKHSQAWIQRVHDPDSVLPHLLHLFEIMQSSEQGKV